jgi:hypothetical protein
MTHVATFEKQRMELAGHVLLENEKYISNFSEYTGKRETISEI